MLCLLFITWNVGNEKNSVTIDEEIWLFWSTVQIFLAKYFATYCIMTVIPLFFIGSFSQFIWKFQKNVMKKIKHFISLSIWLSTVSRKRSYSKDQPNIQDRKYMIVYLSKGSIIKKVVIVINNIVSQRLVDDSIT